VFPLFDICLKQFLCRGGHVEHWFASVVVGGSWMELSVVRKTFLLFWSRCVFLQALLAMVFELGCELVQNDAVKLVRVLVLVPLKNRWSRDIVAWPEQNCFAN
jgi:hypothetical protein